MATTSKTRAITKWAEAVMPLRIWIFVGFQLCGCLYAVWRGGSPERLVAGMMSAAVVLTAAAGYFLSEKFRTVSASILMVDLALLGGLLLLAVRANRFWPMWVAAFQLVSIFVHLARGIDPTLLPEVYNRVLGKFAYPMVVLLIAGTRRHAQRDPHEKDWLPVKW